MAMTMEVQAKLQQDTANIEHWVRSKNCLQMSQRVVVCSLVMLVYVEVCVIHQ